jgi:hypothetical protein
VTNVVRSLGVAAAPLLVGAWGGGGTAAWPFLAGGGLKAIPPPPPARARAHTHTQNTRSAYDLAVYASSSFLFIVVM